VWKLAVKSLKTEARGASRFLLELVQPMVYCVEPPDDFLIIVIIFVFDLDQWRKGDAALE
jgi:hypothetical protein